MWSVLPRHSSNLLAVCWSRVEFFFFFQVLQHLLCWKITSISFLWSFLARWPSLRFRDLFIMFFNISTISIECFLESVLWWTCEICGVAVMQTVERSYWCSVQQWKLKTWSLGIYKWAKVISVSQDTRQASSPYYKRTSVGSASKFESKPQEFSFTLMCFPLPVISLFAEKWTFGALNHMKVTRKSIFQYCFGAVKSFATDFSRNFSVICKH